MIYLVFEDFDDGWFADESGRYEDKILAVFNSKEQATEYLDKIEKELLSDRDLRKVPQSCECGIRNCVEARNYKRGGRSYFRFAVEADFGEINLY